MKKTASLWNFPSSRQEREGSTLHKPHSPFKEVAIDGRKPLQRHGVARVPHDLGGQGDGRRLPGGLPALVDQVQVTVHSGDLIGREGVCAVVICKGAEGEIRIHCCMTSPRGPASQHPSPCQCRAGLFQCSRANGL